MVGFPEGRAVAIATNGTADQLILLPKSGAKAELDSAVFWWDHETGEVQRVAEDFAGVNVSLLNLPKNLMPLNDLTKDEREVIGECLRASVNGPFFPMWEFHTLFGLEHQEVAEIAFGSMPLDDTREDVKIAINNAMNTLTGYPHRCGEEIWRQFISVPPDEVRRILKKWKGTPAGHPFGREVFDEMM